MDDSTANLIVFIGFVVILIGTIVKIFLSTPEELKKKVDEANQRRSEEIKRGIRYSKLHGTKKERKNKF